MAVSVKDLYHAKCCPFVPRFIFVQQVTTFFGLFRFQNECARNHSRLTSNDLRLIKSKIDLYTTRGHIEERKRNRIASKKNP